MIQFELPMEAEQELRANAAQMELSLGAYIEHLLARQGAFPGNYQPSLELVERRQRSVESILSLRSGVDAPTLNLPAGMTLREYMHADHRF